MDDVDFSRSDLSQCDSEHSNIFLVLVVFMVGAVIGGLVTKCESYFFSSQDTSPYDTFRPRRRRRSNPHYFLSAQNAWQFPQSQRDELEPSIAVTVVGGNNDGVESLNNNTNDNDPSVRIEEI